MFDHIRTRIRRRSRILLFGLAAVTSLSFAGVAVAQGPHERGERFRQMSPEQREQFRQRRMDERMERLRQELELTGEQEQQVRQIFVQTHQQRRQLLQGRQGDRRAARAEMRDLREQTRAQLAEVLSPDQLDWLEQHHAERKRHHRRKRFERVADELELDAQQRAQAEAILRSSRQEARQIIEMAGGDRQAARPELRELRRQTRADLAEVLTDEQIEEFKQLRKEQRGRRGPRR